MTGFVYFVKDAAINAVKIGFSIDAESRVNGFKTSNISVSLIKYIPGSRYDEKMLHRFFADKHLSREWFCLTEQDIENLNSTLENLRAQFPEPQKRQPREVKPVIERKPTKSNAPQGFVSFPPISEQRLIELELWETQWRRDIEKNREMVEDCWKMIDEMQSQ